MTGATDDPPPDGEPSGSIEPDRAMLALVLAHQRRAWRRGERRPRRGIPRAAARLRDDPEAVLDLIYQEIVLREEAGESPRARGVPAPVPAPDPPARAPVRGGGGARVGGAWRDPRWRRPSGRPSHPARPGGPAGRSPATRSWGSWAAAAWGSSTRPGSSGSTGSSR